MKSIICLLLVLLISKNHSAQSDYKNEIDFIVVVDDNISITSIASIKIKIKSGDTSQEILLEYHPGALIFKKDDYEKMLASANTTIYMMINYREYVGDHQNIYNYDIEIKRQWLKEEYCILRIYNLGKKKYSNAFVAGKKKLNYLFELDSPNYTFKLVRKK